MTTLLDLAGTSEHARALLEAARDGIDASNLDRLLADHTVPTTRLGDESQRGLLLLHLDHLASLRTAWENGDYYTVRMWTEDEIDGEVLHTVFVLTTGQQPCRCTGTGGLNALRPPETLDDLHAEAACATARSCAA